MRPTGQNRSPYHPSVPEQKRLDFNPIEATPEESERLRRIITRWTLEEAEEEFKQLPGESLSEFLIARDQYLRELETFGPAFPREPSEAWQIVQGLRRAPADKTPRQLRLPFDTDS